MTAQIEVNGRHNNVAGRDLIAISGGDGLARQVFGEQIMPATLTWQRDRFAESQGYPAAANFLRDNKILLLTADAGVRTAALCLLYDVHGVGRTVEHIQVEQDTQLRVRRIAEDALVLIDFRAAEDTRPVETQLGGFIEEQVPDGHVVILLSGNETDDFLARHLRHHLPAPRAEAVLRAHLHRVLPDEQLTKLVDASDWHALSHGARPDEVVHLADLVMRAWREAPDGSWLEDAFAEFHNYSRILSKEFDDKDARERSLLLALALLNNGRNESIYRAEEILLKVTGYQDEEPKHVLASVGFVSRLAKIQNATNSAESAWFTRRDYDTSVLHHVWRGFPQLRKDISDWITRVAFDDRAGLDQRTRGELAARLLALCTDNRDAKPLLAAVEKWVSSDFTLAADLLDQAAVDEKTTVEVRRQMYKWAKEPGLSVLLARAVIEACAGRFGSAHTHLALTRLGRLTGHSPQVVRRVEAALLALAKEHGKTDVVLARMTEWLRTGTTEQWAVAATVVRALTVQGGHDQPGIVAWQAVLASSDHSGVVHELRAWFGAALELAPAPRSEALGLLLAAAGDDRNLLNLLGMCVDWWRRDDPEKRTELHDELRRRIDAQHPVARR